MANEAQTPVTEKTDLKAQLAEVAERIRTMREIIGLSEEEMARKAREQGVDFLPLSHCYHDPTLAPPSTLLCGYGRLPLEEIPALTQALVRAWNS